MLNFSDFLTEAQQEQSVFDSVIHNRVQPPVFLTPSVMNRLNYSVPGVTAFHATNVEGLQGLISKEGSKSTQLSVFTNPGPNAEEFYYQLMGGVETSGGVIAELEGDINAYFSADAFTARLKGGRRSVLIGSPEFVNAVMNAYTEMFDDIDSNAIMNLINQLSKELMSVQDSVLDQYIVPLIKEVYKNNKDTMFSSHVNRDIESAKDWKEAWKAIQFIAVSRDLPFESDDLASFVRHYDTRGKIMRLIVKDYMDGMEKVIAGNPNYKKIFNMPYEGTRQADNIPYDEAIMSNFKVKIIHLFPTRTQLKYFRQNKIVEDEEMEEFMADYADEHLDYKHASRLWAHEGFIQALYKYVQSKVPSFSEIYKKKAKKL